MNRRVILIAILPLLTLSGCEKYELDRQMKSLCQADGGVKVYERVRLAPQMFDQSGDVKATLVQKNGKSFMLIASEYMETEDTTVLKDGDPIKGEGWLGRVHLKISRIADGSILAEGVQYRRAGGDGFYIGHHTQSTCPNSPMELHKAVFSLQSVGGK
jgi:hypothetical protein